MLEYDIDVTYINFDNLKCGYGSAHCLTQVVNRKNNKVEQSTNNIVMVYPSKFS